MSSEPEGLYVKYLGGFAGQRAKTIGGGFYKVRADEDAFRVFWGSQKGSWTGTYRWVIAREESWARLRGLHLASSQATQANVPAIAMFGVLGLAARREPGTLIGVSYADGDVFFRARTPTPQLALEFSRLVELIPEAAGKLTVDGVALGGQTTSTATATRDDLFDQIRHLGELLAEGLLSQAEFDAKKAELLSRL